MGLLQVSEFCTAPKKEGYQESLAPQTLDLWEEAEQSHNCKEFEPQNSIPVLICITSRLRSVIVTLKFMRLLTLTLFTYLRALTPVT